MHTEEQRGFRAGGGGESEGRNGSRGSPMHLATVVRDGALGKKDAEQGTNAIRSWGLPIRKGQAWVAPWGFLRPRGAPREPKARPQAWAQRDRRWFPRAGRAGGRCGPSAPTGMFPGLGSLTVAESLKSRLLQWLPFLTVTDYVLNKYLRID